LRLHNLNCIWHFCGFYFTQLKDNAMKTLLLAAAALLAISTSAHAGPTLPKSMLGGWCSVDKGSSFVRRANAKGDPDCIVVSRKHYYLSESGCKIEYVERVAQGSYLVRSKCEIGGMADAPMISYRMFQLYGGKLVISEVDDLPVNRSTKAMILKWQALRGDCHGSPDADRSCQRAKKLYPAITKRGSCWGKQDQARADFEWHKCTRGSLRD
jgi:hypothetical protein